MTERFYQTLLSVMEQKVREHDRIFIDTCSLLDAGADKFWMKIIPFLYKYGKYIVIAVRVYQEVQKFAFDATYAQRKGKPELRQIALTVLARIEELHKVGLVQFFGDANDNFADNVFQTVFTQHRLKYNMLLITQDRNLSTDIINISKSRSVTTSNKITVMRITNNGILREFDPNWKRPTAETDSESKSSSSAAAQRPTTSIKKPTTSIKKDEIFAIAQSVTHITGKMPITREPKEGSILTAERGRLQKSITLQQKISAGGEGTIYFTNIPKVVAKIYKPEKLNRAKFEKLRLMTTKSLDCQGICLPQALLYNANKEFVGYLMEQAEGKELQKCLFIPKLLLKTFPNWTKVETVTLCITILEKIKYLHDRNVILGDINPLNILVKSPKDVYFVDTDSYQIEGFPCPVGTINFTAPEIQRKTYSDFLRTVGNERFAVATLLFMIMLPGKPPYSLQGGENQIDNIINGDFAYASGERSTGKAPEGMWRFCWSHMPRYLKDDFYETFRKEGEHHAEDKRFSTDDWLDKFKYYLKLLKDGTLQNNDEMSIDIFPTRLKRNKNANYINCKLCGKEVDEERTQQGICNECLYHKGEIYHCGNCGKELLYTNFQKLIKQSNKHRLCDDCFKQMNSVYCTVTCSVCGQQFNLTYGDKAYYDSKGYTFPPKKCKNCRQLSKQ